MLKTERFSGHVRKIQIAVLKYGCLPSLPSVFAPQVGISAHSSYEPDTAHALSWVTLT